MPPPAKLAAIRFASAVAFIRMAILAVAVLLAVAARYATGSVWAFLIVLAIGVFGGPPLIERRLWRRFVRD